MSDEAHLPVNTTWRSWECPGYPSKTVIVQQSSPVDVPSEGLEKESAMRHSIKTGFSFGLTSGIITTIGLMVGLHSGTGSRLAVLGGILIIAIADAFSDALGIHLSEESENRHATREIWESTISTFLSKFICAATFIIPLFLFRLSTAVIVGVIWGLSLLSIFSFFVAKKQKVNPWRAVSEHLLIAFGVIFITHYLGDWISTIFK